MSKAETIIQTLLFLGFLGFTVGSFMLITVVYTAAPFAFFGNLTPVSISVGLLTAIVAIILLVLFILRRRKKKKHY